MMSNAMTGIILSGGRSSRFGRDKGLFPFRGKPLVEHAIDILRSNFDDIRISTNQPEAYSYLELPMIGDIHQGCGPLGGLHAALRFERERGSERKALSIEHRAWSGEGAGIAVISCDTPFVHPELYAFMLDMLKDHDAVVPVHGKFVEATCGIYTTKCLPAFEKAIKEKRFKILEALKETNTLFLKIDKTSFYQKQMFHNINYMRDTIAIPPKEH